MILEQCASISQGAFLSRVQTLPSSDALKLSLYTMKEMNERFSTDSSGSTEKLQEVYVPKNKMDDLPISKEGMVLISLTGLRAAAIHHEHTGKLIPSNFAIIEPLETLNSDYMEWYVNEHPSCRKQLRIATQGSSVSALSIQMLRTLEIELPSMTDQRMIGIIYRSLRQKKRLLNERMDLEQTLIKHLLLRYLKEDSK